MKAVVMAGGEGTRLRPMTANQPKPLLPVANRPIMEHVLRLLKRHGFDETVVTVQFLAAMVRNYFGDGEDVGLSLQYATEETPLGTAGSVKNAEEALKDDTFLVISGDALTDMDLSEMTRFHKESGALVTVGLTRVPDPLEFGIVIADDDGRIQRFLEKPTWGQVFSDTVNTGVYIMEPEVLAEVSAKESVDWSHDVFPKLLQRGAPIYGYISDKYWEDVGTLESYLKAQADVLAGRVETDIAGFEVSPGVWIAEGADVDPEAVLTGPVCIGEYAKIEAGARIREYSVIGANVVVKEGAFVHRAVVHNNVFVGQGTTLRGCVVGKNTDVMRLARIEETAVVGDECVIEPEAYISAGVKVYPFKTIEAGAVVNTSVVWESRGSRTLFGQHGVSGLINVEVTPELCVRLASAYATTLKKGSTVTTSRDVSRAARTLKRAVQGALNASAINVMDLEALPLPVARFETARSDYSGGIALRTTPGDTQSIDIIFLDEVGAELSQPAQRKLERVVSRQEFRRAFPGEIAELSYPPRIVEWYTHELLRTIDLSGVRGAGLRVVADTAGGTVSVVLPTLLGRIDVDVHTLNNRLDEVTPTQTVAQNRAGLQRLAEVVSSSRATFGVRFDPVGERIALVDEKGALVSDERALLVVLDLVAAERNHGRVALPVTTTRVAEQVCRFHGVQVDWTPTATDALTAAAAHEDVILAADGRGGFIVPEFGRTVDGIAAFVRLLGLVARTRLTLSQIDARIPQAHLLRRSVPTPWSAKGSVMRLVVEAAGDRPVDTTDGVRIIEPDTGWVLVLPDPAEAVTHLWAEGNDADSAQQLLDEWAAVVERAGA
ncbi:MAG TPA: mannose-1-phosphate guanyltransferase [Trebonia sp.]